MAEIHCTVEACYYNDRERKRCSADSIMIRPNPHGATDMEVGALGRAFQARRSVETCCETFRPRDEEPGPDEKNRK